MEVKIKIKGEWETKKIWLNGELLSPDKSQSHINHSPDGFSWGYGGSGPSQLALAICLEIYDVEYAFSMYQHFKGHAVSIWPQADFEQYITIEK